MLPSALLSGQKPNKQEGKFIYFEIALSGFSLFPSKGKDHLNIGQINH
ncbi:hypothetical protein [uncultured Imperialibacter sp.]|tara:strand:- start:2005 stop:2148 length:144 start_codon:yes stop_codon:yes gene_type:complete